MSPYRPAAHRRSNLRNAIAAGVVLLSVAVSATTAVAADAPTRTIARDAAGNATNALYIAGVSDNGHEVVGTISGNIVVRDVVNGVTRVLVPGAITGPWTPSTDLRYILGVTAQNGVIPGDSDGQRDLFIFDRTTGAITKVTREQRTFADGTTPDAYDWAEVQMSGDGRFVSYRLQTRRFATDVITAREEASLWQFDRTTGQTRRLRTLAVPQAADSVKHTDTAGDVIVTGAFAYVGSRTIPLPVPSTTPQRGAQYAVSSNGQVIGVQPFAEPRTIKLVSVATGATTATISVPTTIAPDRFDLVDVAGDGSTVVVRARRTLASGALRDGVFRVDTAGNVTQIGGDIVAFTEAGTSILSTNLAFAANGAVLVQLGSLPLPGVEPAAITQPITTWMSTRDVSCARNFWGQVSYIRANVTAASTPQGLDPRTPSRVAVKAYKTGAPSTIYNQFTVAAGVPRQLTVPQTGGWSYSATITFTDGSTTSGVIDIPAHPAPRC